MRQSTLKGSRHQHRSRLCARCPDRLSIPLNVCIIDSTLALTTSSTSQCAPCKVPTRFTAPTSCYISHFALCICSQAHTGGHEAQARAAHGEQSDGAWRSDGSDGKWQFTCAILSLSVLEYRHRALITGAGRWGRELIESLSYRLGALSTA